MAPEVRKRRNNVPAPPPEIDVDLPTTTPFQRILSGCGGAGTPTPRSTLGSPLTSSALAFRRSGVGDLGGGPRRRISLSEVELLPWVCCMTPAICLFSLYSTVIFTAFFSPYCFYLFTAGLTCITMLWVSNLAFSSLMGAYKLRKGSSQDWHAMLQDLPPEVTSGVTHIVLLPNYMENEKMLKETLDNLALSRMASNCLRIVLAMEAREGPAARDKADRIIKEKAHLFSDIFATYHPGALEGEVAGKSSNTQWAFRETLRRYGAKLAKQDLSKVFITVADADTLLHPQYFSALAYQGLTMSTEERSWTMWQSPVLLMRNIFSVPAMTRATAHATLIFELSSLANQRLFPAFAYSAYSMTLALASHPEVDGWDVDVIAEDHHMYCKCFFAALWEEAHASQEAKRASKLPDVKGVEETIIPKVKVDPIFLPAVSYLVESTEGYFPSCYARFQQARRHSQGVIELGYVILQYARLAGNVGFFKIPLQTHTHIWTIAVKMHTLHITTTAQCFALMLAGATTVVPRLLTWLWTGELWVLVHAGVASIFSQLTNGWGGLDMAQQALVGSLSQISGVAVFYSFTCWLVMADLIDGTYYVTANSAAPDSPLRTMRPVAEGTNEGPSTPTTSSESEPKEAAEESIATETAPSSGTREKTPYEFSPSIPSGPRSLLWRIGLYFYIFADTTLSGYPAILFYGVVPTLLAGWSLFRRGTDFEYIVAPKPESD